jgi:hypothetical protein
MGHSLLSYASEKKTDPAVYSSSTPFRIVSRTQRFYPGTKNGKPEFKPFEKLTYTLYRSGVPLGPIMFNGYETEDLGAKRFLKGCFHNNNEKATETRELKFQKVPIGWLIRLSEECGPTPRYRYRIIGVQNLFKGSFEWDFFSRSLVTIKETDGGLEFWALTPYTNKLKKTETLTLFLPKVHELQVKWGKPFLFRSIPLNSDPAQWPELQSFEKNFQTYFFTGLRDLNSTLINLALESYFSSEAEKDYKQWGIPTNKTEIEQFIGTLKELESKSKLSDLVLSRGVE